MQDPGMNNSIDKNKGKEKVTFEEDPNSPREEEDGAAKGDAEKEDKRPPPKEAAPISKVYIGNICWILTRKLGEGSFGEIYQGENDKDPKDVVAVKLGKGEGREMLMREARVMQNLRGYDGIPEVRGTCSEGEYYVMVMDLLTASLSDLLAEYDLNLKSILILADQMIRHLEYIHTKGVLHGDLKPSNFLLGRGEKENFCYLIDFGLCEEYKHPESKKHIPYSDKHGFHGTPRYCSIHVHNGIASSRRDDMESLGYVLIYLLLGKLPWQNLPAEENETKKQKRKKIADMKQNIPIEELCKGLPEEFATYIQITRNYKFKQTPDYSELRLLFENLFIRSGYGTYEENRNWKAQLQRKKKKSRRPRSTKPEDAPPSPRLREDLPAQNTSTAPVHGVSKNNDGPFIPVTDKKDGGSKPKKVGFWKKLFGGKKTEAEKIEGKIKKAKLKKEKEERKAEKRRTATLRKSGHY